ncbi:hypothetical protein [Qipengyuania sp. MTN3-11]|uniref:hypothetical protein n=1 Tax=Qipengyuania sp. MTN3-11 TaxID=3056557 RepID=UPI0036F3323D
MRPVIGKPRGLEKGYADWPILVFIAIGFTILVLLTPGGRHAPELLLRDPDNVMRLVQVRDFLAGQSWWDVSQHRMAAGIPNNMHWSRLADLPLAALILFFSLFADTARAEVLAVIVEPPLLLIPTLYFLGRAAANLAGDEAAKVARLLALTATLFLSQFAPGRIDHHNIQLVLLALCLSALTDRPSWRAGAIAGTAIGLSLNIGLEMAPLLAIACAGMAARWLIEGAPMARIFNGLIAGLMVSSVFFYVLSVPPGEYARATADQLGRGHFVAIGSVGTVLLFASDKTSTNRRTRLLWLIMAAIAGVSAPLLAPELVRSPYSNIPPRLYDLWIENIRETASIVDVAQSQPSHLPRYFMFILIAFAVGLWLAKDLDRRGPVLLLLGVLAGGLVLTMWQLRAGAAASCVAIVIASAAIAHVWQGTNGRRSRAVAGTLVLVMNGWSGLALQALLERLEVRSENRTGQEIAGMPSGAIEGEEERPISRCEAAVRAAPLDSVPPGLVLSSLDAGAPILLRSRHETLSLGFHRNVQGVATTVDALLAPPDAARKILTARGVAYLFYCPSLEFGGFPRSTDASLGAMLAVGNAPEWLQPIAIAPTGDYAFYAVR